ncbi:T9SS type A sorting domain-containing protein [Candidatus Latescibacterota bacterium]
MNRKMLALIVLSLLLFSLTSPVTACIDDLIFSADCDGWTITARGYAYNGVTFIYYDLTLKDEDGATVEAVFIDPLDPIHLSSSQDLQTWEFNGSWDGDLCEGEYTVTGSITWISKSDPPVIQDPIIFGTTFDNCECEGEGTCDAHTIGFWKNNINKAIQGKDKGIQVTKLQLETYLAAISTPEIFEGLSLEEAYDILSPEKIKKQDKLPHAIQLLMKQLLAAVLNYESGSYIEGGQAATLAFIQQGEAMLSSTSVADILDLKDLYDDFNNNVNCIPDEEPEPPVDTDCGCRGKVNYLELKYLGDVPATITVEQKKAMQGEDPIRFTDLVDPDGIFEFYGVDKKGTLGTEITITSTFTKDGETFVYTTEIHTSCSQPIGIGMIFGESPILFEVLDGTSKDGGTLECPPAGKKALPDPCNTCGREPQIIQSIQNYPNPFNPVTTINFSLPQSEYVTLTIYNTLGERIATLVEGEIPAGTHSAVWNAKGFASGIYFYRIEAGSFVETKQMMFIK